MVSWSASRNDLTPELSNLTMPVLVLQRKDAIFPTVENARKIAAIPPKAELLLLEGRETVPFLGDMDSVLRSIFQFLSEAGERRPGGLTERELEILTLLSGGSSNQQIAMVLSIGTRTVDRHIGNIYLKIGAHNRAEATAYAYERGVTPLSHVRPAYSPPAPKHEAPANGSQRPGMTPRNR